MHADSNVSDDQHKNEQAAEAVLVVYCNEIRRILPTFSGYECQVSS